MISKKNPSIPEFIEEKKCRPVYPLRIFSVHIIYFGQIIRFNLDTCNQF